MPFLIPKDPPPAYGSWPSKDHAADGTVGSSTGNTILESDRPGYDPPEYTARGKRQVYETVVSIPPHGDGSQASLIFLRTEYPIIGTEITWDGDDVHLHVNAGRNTVTAPSQFDEALAFSKLQRESPFYTPSRHESSRSNTGTLASKIPGSTAAREFLFGFKGDDPSVVSLFSSNYRPPQPSGLSVAMSSAYTGVSSVMTPIASGISGVASRVYNAPSALGSYLSSMAPWSSPSNEVSSQRPLSTSPWSIDTGFDSQNGDPSFVIVTPS